MGWNQWHNLLPLVYGCWLRWWHLTGDEPSAIVPIKNSRKTLQQQHSNKEKTGQLQSKLQIWLHTEMPYSKRQIYHKAFRTWYLWDETSLETSSYGEGGTGLTGQNFSNNIIMKGSQTVLVSDVHCIRSCAYMHRKKLHVSHPGCNLCWGNPNMDLGLNPSGKRVGPVILPSKRLCLRNPQEQSKERCWSRISGPRGLNSILISLLRVSTYYLLREHT